MTITVRESEMSLDDLLELVADAHRRGADIVIERTRLTGRREAS